MPWLAIDDAMVEHRKVQAVSDRAFRLHVAALCSCARRLTDGRLTDLDVDVVRVVANRASMKHVHELEQAGLWHRVDGGWEINDYLDYNPTADEVKRKRQLSAERQQRHRDRKAA